MKVQIILCIIAVLADAKSLETPKTYHGYKVYRVEFETEDDFFALEELSQEFDVFHISKVNNFVDILIPPEKEEFFKRFIQNHHYNYVILQENLEL